MHLGQVVGGKKLINISEPILACVKVAEEESGGDEQMEASAWNSSQHYSNSGDFRPSEVAMSRIGLVRTVYAHSFTVLSASLSQGLPYN